jgi:hypothetical protein
MSQSTPKLSSRTRNAVRESSLCKFPFSDGRRCRMLRHPSHPTLCPFHARAELQLRESATLGTELSTTISGNFLTATDINHALGKLYTAVAQDRVPARTAATMAYIGQLLLNSIPGIKSEYKFCYKFDQWRSMLADTQPLSPPLSLTPEPSAPEPSADDHQFENEETTNGAAANEDPNEELTESDSANEEARDEEARDEDDTDGESL